MDFDRWFRSFSDEKCFHQVFVTDKNFTPLICGIAQIEAFENRYINSVYSAFLNCKDALEKAELDDPLDFTLWVNDDYSKAIIFFFESNGQLNKIKVYPNLKNNSFYCYQQINSNEEDCINFIKEYIDCVKVE